jgi:hypothetical protein
MCLVMCVCALNYQALLVNVHTEMYLHSAFAAPALVCCLPCDACSQRQNCVHDMHHTIAGQQISSAYVRGKWPSRRTQKQEIPLPGLNMQPAGSCCVYASGASERACADRVPFLSVSVGVPPGPVSLSRSFTVEMTVCVVQPDDRCMMP